MKKVLFIFMMLSITVCSFGQGGNKMYENYADKHIMVNTITVLNRTFNIGDTIITTQGSGTQGEFLSIKYLLNPSSYLDAQYINYKFIILKIYNRTDGLNSMSQIVCELYKLHIYIDPIIAITRKEIK